MNKHPLDGHWPGLLHYLTDVRRREQMRRRFFFFLQPGNSNVGGSEREVRLPLQVH